MNTFFGNPAKHINYFIPKENNLYALQHFQRRQTQCNGLFLFLICSVSSSLYYFTFVCFCSVLIVADFFLFLFSFCLLFLFSKMVIAHVTAPYIYDFIFNSRRMLMEHTIVSLLCHVFPTTFERWELKSGVGNVLVKDNTQSIIFILYSSATSTE